MANFLLIMLGIWAVVMAAWFFTSRAFRSADIDKIKSRLTGGSSRKKAAVKAGGNQALLNEDARTGRVADLLKKYNLLPVLHNLLEQAGLKWDPVKLIHSCLFAFVVCFGLTWSVVPGNLRYVALLAGFLGAAIPILYVLRLKKVRLRRFEELFPESLEFVARSMRAGHAFSVSL